VKDRCHVLQFKLCTNCYLWYTYTFEYNQVPWKQVKDNLRVLTWVMIRVVVAAAVLVVVVVIVVLYDLHC